ncbi:hypothetical protein M885DRAFT_617498 [Pelagophyceae sp. CCMP2097]|nr:hypothetical protein M885DRAFT_617498 [Pelagophyceae sp. CCMP2097]
MSKGRVHATLAELVEADSQWPPPQALEDLMGEREVAKLDEIVAKYCKDPSARGVSGATMMLGSNASSGLFSDGGLARRALHFGVNSFAAKPPTTYLTLWWGAMHDGAIVVLSVMTIITIFVWVFVEKPSCNPNGWMEPIALVFSISAITHTTALIDYQKERMFASLTAQLDASNKKFVVRGGESMELADAEIVVGDIVTFNSHNAASIPADGLLVAGSNVKMDEAALNGEPEPSEKSVEEKPFILSGTTCSSGSGKMLVICASRGVGKHSASGKIKAAVYGASTEDSGSPLFDKLDAMSLKIGKGGMAVALFVFFIMLIKGVLIDGHAATEIIHYMVQAITILAVAVPEGLPLAVTLSLAFSSSKMMQDNNLVKALKACETMGSATTICSDKTGTLTANRMTLRGACIAGELVAVLDPRTAGADALKSVGKRCLEEPRIPRAALDLVGILIAVDTMDESTVSPPLNVGEKAVFKGNPTECALLDFAATLGTDWRTVRETTEGRSEATALIGKPFMFSSARKVMSWAVPLPGGGFRVFCKGAAEIVLARCTSTYSESGPQRLDAGHVQSFYLDGVVKDFAAEAMRTIALAYKDCATGGIAVLMDWEATTDSVKNSDGSDAFVAETDLTLLAVVGIEDPLRDEVPPAIAKCYVAGIDVRMCTGDNLATAVAIAARCGILRDEHYVDGVACGAVEKLKPDRAMTGREFRRRVHAPGADGAQVFNQAAFDGIWPRLRVMARCDPEDKNTLAHGLNKSVLYKDAAACAALLQEGIKIFPDRQVVAMTGDGTNDAPALKRADVGFAMGISGTQIAKDAADIILLDDNFASIVTAAKWGRNVYDSVCKFLQFQLTVNIAAIVTAVVGAFRYQESPIAAVQMLWINLIMDSLASLALATEPPSEELLQRPPVNRSESIVSPQMWWNMIGHATYQISVMMLLFFEAGPIILRCDSNGTPDVGGCGRPHFSKHHTALFNCFVMMTLCNEINCRKLQGEWNVFSGLTKNKYFMAIWVLTFVLQVAGVEFARDLLAVNENGLTPWQWLVCILFGLGEFVVQQAINLLRAAYLRRAPAAVAPRKIVVAAAQHVQPVSTVEPAQ